MLDHNDRQYDANSCGKRYVIHQGGTGSGKTYSVLQYLLDYAILNQGVIISVVSESIPHLKRGAMRDLKYIIETNKWNNLVVENKTNHCFKLGKSTIEFFPADSASKLRGARRDILFINECNNVDFESFQQLDIRTRRRTILDFNPVSRFWVHDNLMPSLTEDKYIFMKSTYADNLFLTAEEKDNIERRRNNNNWWKVYGEGEIGVTEGLIISNWTIASPPSKGGINTACSENTNLVHSSPLGSGGAVFIPPLEGREAGTLLGYGIDFGYSHSPTAIVQVNEYNGEWWVHELLYRNGLQNDELFAFAQKHLNLSALAVADSAEPKSIDYLFRKGWHGLKGAIKGEDSVLYGIDLINSRKMNVSPESLNLIKELRQYMWDTNRDGVTINRPVKEFDHAIDALRYVVSYPKKRKLVFA